MSITYEYIFNNVVKKGKRINCNRRIDDKMIKIKNYIEHTIKRLKERYNIILTLNDIPKLIESLNKTFKQLPNIQSKRGYCWYGKFYSYMSTGKGSGAYFGFFYYKGIKIICVYSYHYNLIKTVYPKNYKRET